MRRTWLIFSQAVTVAVAMLFVIATLKPDWLRRDGRPGPPDIVQLITAAPSDPAVLAPQSYAAAASRATPAVASVRAVKPAREDFSRYPSPWDGPRPQARESAESGSAVIASPEGYLLTNHHVIDGAQRIDVALGDGRRAQARLIGSDPETDIAVLKIDLDALPVITFGHSESLQVGDVVMAIGNPFGVGLTVTAGIVSGLDRSELGFNAFENFIQTDAAINPGNSGGALIDVQGHLVGINSAILAGGDGRGTVGNIGIGFAIPAHTARLLMESLIREGSIVRGWIGVVSEDLAAEVVDDARAGQRGVRIIGVQQDGPADRGGLQPGDILLRVDGQPVAGKRDLLNKVAALRPATQVVIGVQRRQQTLDLKVTVDKRVPLDRRN